jgi:flagellin-like hook-associated protein FlgL
MRVTSSMLINNFMHNLSNNLQKVDKLQTQLANNSKFAHISDDPIGVLYGRNARYNLHLLEHYNTNLDYGSSWLEAAETGAMSLSGTLADAYNACIDSATDAKTSEDRLATGQLIGQLRDNLLDALNSAFGDRFVFGAYNTTGMPDGNAAVTPPFTVGEADHVSYKGVDLVNANEREKTEFMKDVLLSSAGLSGNSRFSINDSWHLTFDGYDLVTAEPDVLYNLFRDLSGSDVGPSFMLDDSLGENHLKLGTVDFSDAATTDDQKLEALQTLFETDLPTNFSVNSDLHLEFTPAGGAPVDLAEASESEWKSTMLDIDPTTATALGTDFSTVKASHLKFNGVDLVTATETERNTLMQDVLTLDMGPGIDMAITLNGVEVAIFDKDGNNIYNLLDDFYNAMCNENNTAEDIAEFIKPLQDAQEHILALTAQTGGRMNRIEMLSSRYEQDYINYTQMKSDAEDADEAELIMLYEMARMVYEASLKTGANIMQMSLLDFLG